VTGPRADDAPPSTARHARLAEAILREIADGLHPVGGRFPWGRVLAPQPVAPYVHSLRDVRGLLDLAAASRLDIAHEGFVSTLKGGG
jgi:hypothetical protein